jgi:glycosyltransferase involved in cell wall biosynthesis
MAAGRPIIASMNGEGARLVIEAGAGLVAPAEDARALADAILSLHGQSHEVLKRMGDNGRRFYQEQFGHDELVDQLVGHLHSVSLQRKASQ